MMPLGAAGTASPPPIDNNVRLRLVGVSECVLGIDKVVVAAAGTSVGARGGAASGALEGGVVEEAACF